MPSRPQKAGVVIRPATLADVDFTARAHRQHLPHGLFPLMGHSFMKRWHASFLGAPDGIALVAVHVDGDGERLLGFLVGAGDQVAHVQHVLRHHRSELTVSGICSLLVRPRLALHFLRTRARAYARRLTSRATSQHRRGDPGKARPQAPQTSGPDRCPDPVAVVTALVVVPQAQGAGVGAALLARFVDQARAGSAAEAHLTTLAGANGAGPFYEALGWRRRDVHPTRDGTLVATYELELVHRAAPVPTLAHTMDYAPENGDSPHDQRTS